MLSALGNKCNSFLADSVILSAEPDEVLFDTAGSALIVVDMQNDFLHPEGWFPSTGRTAPAAAAIIPSINAIASAARNVNVPVIWVNWGVRADAQDIPPELMRKASANGTRAAYGDPSPSGRGQILVRGDWGSEIAAGLDKKPGDLTVYKHRYTGFYETELGGILRARQIQNLLFTGINTDRCVYATLIDACNRGYRCILVEDACATLSTPEVQTSILFLVRLLYGYTSHSNNVLKALHQAKLVMDRKSP